MMRARLIGIALALAGCSGVVAPMGEDQAGGGDERGGSSGANGGEGGSGVVGVAGIPTPAACKGARDIGKSLMRRLTNAEYAATVRWLLQLPGPPTVPLAPDTSKSHFPMAGDQAFTPTITDGYMDAAAQLATALVADAPRRDRVVGCQLATKDCLRTFVERFGRRAFRRPLTGEETDRLLALAAGDGQAGVEAVVRAVLASTKFLYLVELGTPAPDSAGVVLLTAWEQVTRLSFLLWGAAPDDELLDAAASGAFSDPRRRAAIVAAAIKDPRTRAGQRALTRAWLGLDDVVGLPRDARKYPLWNPTLAAAAAEETQRFVDDLMWRDGASFAEALTSRSTFLSEPLAKLYAVALPTDGSRVTFPAGVRGAGLLTHASVLALAAGTELNTPIKRAVFVRHALLCQELPPPPANVPSIDKVALPPNATPRERLAAHRTAPECAACHKLLDPLGFGLDEYDAIGAYRTKSADGQPINASGTIEGVQGGGDFRGAVELGALLAKSPEFGDCVAQTLFRFATARDADAADECTVASMQASFHASGLRYPALLGAFVDSDAFQLRRMP